MKLYDLNRGDKFTLIDKAQVPPDAPDSEVGVVYELDHIDGMYSYITKPGTDEVYHFAAWTEVEKVE